MRMGLLFIIVSITKTTKTEKALHFCKAYHMVPQENEFYF